MDQQKRLLIIANQPSTNTRMLSDAVVRGASHDAIENVQVLFREPLLATSDDVLSCHGIIIGTTENFGSMSGLIKDFFERIYYHCLEQTQGLPYALYVRAGNDGTGARQSVERIITGLRWSAIQPCKVFSGDYQPRFVADCEELGMMMAGGLDAGIY